MNYTKIRKEILKEIDEEREREDNKEYLEQLKDLGIEVLN